MLRSSRLIIPVALCGILVLGGPPAAPRPDTQTNDSKARQLPQLEKPVEPLDLIPADNLLCWKGLPLPDVQQQEGDPSSLAVLLDLFSRIGKNPLGPKEQLTLRVFETLGQVVRYPFAVSLIDTQAKAVGADGSSRKVDKLRIVAVIKTEGNNRPFIGIIQKTVRTMTDAGVATLAKKKAGLWTYQELRDSRLPSWCVIAWGPLGNHFVITVGEGVWARIARVAAGEEPSVNRDAWLAAVRSQREQEPLIEVIVASKRIRERLDPFVSGRATAFFRAWDSEDTLRVHWALGFEGPALYCVTNSMQDHGTKRVVYADPSYADRRLLQTIPPGAHYAVYKISVARFLPRLISSFYATRSAADREMAVKLWEKVQADLKIDAERDALANLGNRIVLHNYPQHPLHLPLAFTSLIEIRSNPAQVRKTLETLCEAWRDAIDKVARDAGESSIAQIYRDDDGIWFIQFGPVAGLAWTFTDNFIITSWSPKALRDYIEHYGDRIGVGE